MKKNRSISLAKQGMSKDMSVDSLQNQNYTFAINMNIENSSGDLLKLKSEHSNVLAYKFKEGYKVIGFETDINEGNTYYFLTNPETGISEIGYIRDSKQTNLENDLEAECEGCDKKNILPDPLEEIVQESYLNYETLLTDGCEVKETGDINTCLNFNVDYPIKKVIIKSEKAGVKIFFSDNLNPPRYLDLSRLDEYKYIGEVVCNTDDTIETCVACDKLRMFPIYMPIKVVPTEIVLGGRLPQGQYSFYVAYTNRIGDEMSEYTSLTNPVSIFDENNRILLNSEKSENTNYAIKLKVKEIDRNFKYYKVVVAYSNLIDGGTRYYQIGNFPTTNEEILVDTVEGKPEENINNILIPNPNIKLMEGLAESNNYLFGYGITKEKEWNLQPIVNLLGGFFKWQTHIAKETLYENGVNNSLYKSYLRDEVYPLAISFTTNTGYRTARFPLIARPPKENDIELVDNTDTQSIQAGLDTCNSSGRSMRWQYYNTAEEIGRCGIGVDVGNIEIGVKYEIESIGTTDFTIIGAATNTVGEVFVATGVGQGTGVVQESIPTNTVEEQVTKICRLESVETLGAGSFVIEDINSYDGVESTINEKLSEGECSGYPFCDGLDIESYPDCTPDFENCSAPGEPVQQYLEVESITGEEVTINYKNFPEGYSVLRVTDSCRPHTIGSDGNKIRDLNFEEKHIGTVGSIMDEEYYKVYARNSITSNTTPAYASELTYATDVSQLLSQSYSYKYEGYSNVGDSQLVDFNTGSGDFGVYQPETNAVMDYVFGDKVSKSSLWFKVNGNNLNETSILEITKLAQDEVWKTVATFGRKVRVSIFDSSTQGTAIYSRVMDIVSSGGQIKLELDTTNNTLVVKNDDNEVGTPPIPKPNNLYISIEVPHTPSKGTEQSTGGVFTFPLQGCFGVGLRAQEIENIVVSYDTIVLNKVQKYTAECSYEVPLVSDCGVVPHKYGEFAYWESVNTYPDNNELYNSRLLEIKREDFKNDDVAEEFISKYVELETPEGELKLSEEADFTCKPIRHYKFPDNKVSPFMYSNAQTGFVKTLIYPIGVTIDEEVVNKFLDIAVNNELITKEQRDSIVSYEVFRGDRTLNKGIVAKGLLYDMYEYTEDGSTIKFSNFPYNSLGNNELYYENESRTTAIKHPGQSQRNSSYTFHSPETEYNRPGLPTEVKVEGYVFGKSKGVFDEVEGHPKYVILGKEAIKLAKSLATLEVIAEVAIIAAQSAEAYRFQVGFANSGNPIGIGLNIASVAANALGSALFKYGRYKYQWLETFRNLGSVENFAYYYTSVGEYNYIQPLQEEGNTLRGIMKTNYIGSGRFTVVNEIEGVKSEINNVDREDSVYIDVGSTFPINYPEEYRNYDNYNTDKYLSSRFTESTTLDCTVGRSKEFVKNIASPYVSIKNYIPSQYGGIDNIEWITTSYSGNLKKPKTTCLAIYGGDTFISRHTLKRKIPLFLQDAMGLESRTPFNYRAYSNLGTNPKYYSNFMSPDEVTLDRGMPNLRSEYSFDCLAGEQGFYVKSPSKFYLYYYGIPSFLTETTINTNYRTGRPEKKELFYPLTGDYVDWTQEEQVSIKERNTYHYSNPYSRGARMSIGRNLPATYSKEIYDKLYDAPNGVIYSLPDNNENELTEPWLVFKPLNKHEFSTSYGKLIELRGIETAQMLGRFENKTAIFNAVDVLVDGVNSDNAQLGRGGIFARRPVTFADTDLGYAGSQTTNMVSTEYGHVFVDAKRGQIFKVASGGKGLEEISSHIGNQPSGMKNWFKEHLPFKVLDRKIDGFENIDIDNPYNGIGIVLGWDSRYKRVFITKKDYKPIQPIKWTCGGFYDSNESNYATEISIKESLGYTYQGIEGCELVFTDRVNKSEVRVKLDKISLTDTRYFEDVSWTIAYSMVSNSWVSYYDYKPNYYVSHNNYFQTGINMTTDIEELGLWSHLVTNKSYSVFYGKKYELGFEYPIINSYNSKKLEAIELWAEGLRYQNEYDYAYNKEINFNKMSIYNNRETTGNLKLIPQKSLRDIRNYPKTTAEGQEILMTNSNDRWTINYLYNRVKSEDLNQPVWAWDRNQIQKKLNQNLVSFKGKRVLERLRGNYFLVYLGYDKDSRYELSFKWAIADEEVK